MAWCGVTLSREFGVPPRLRLFICWFGMPVKWYPLLAVKSRILGALDATDPPALLVPDENGRKLDPGDLLRCILFMNDRLTPPFMTFCCAFSLAARWAISPRKGGSGPRLLAKLADEECGTMWGGGAILPPPGPLPPWSLRKLSIIRFCSWIVLSLALSLFCISLRVCSNCKRCDEFNCLRWVFSAFNCCFSLAPCKLVRPARWDSTRSCFNRNLVLCLEHSICWMRLWHTSE